MTNLRRKETKLPMRDNWCGSHSAALAGFWARDPVSGSHQPGMPRFLPFWIPQRTSPRERLGFLFGVRNPAHADTGRGRSFEFPRHLLKPTAGEGAADDPAAERLSIRTRFWRD